VRQAQRLVVSRDDDGNWRVWNPGIPQDTLENGIEGQDKSTVAGGAHPRGAAAARLVLLSMKPPHFDEGVNGWFVDQMTHTGFYHYDPTNYHGPFHFYVLFLFQTLFGRHIWALRLPLALISVATVCADAAVRPFHWTQRGALGRRGDGALSGRSSTHGTQSTRTGWCSR
jgi:hypothetical protein